MEKNRKSVAAICLCLFIFFALLASLFPYSGDDWAWGSSIGVERLKTYFDNYNGRYLGNLTVMALTRSKLLDIAVMAIAYMLVCFFCYVYTEDRSQISILLAAVLFLLMPKKIWAQTIVWTAGFTNYVLSALISVAFLVSIRDITGSKRPVCGNTLLQTVLMIILGFCGALFVESITVFNACLAAAVIFYEFLKFKRYRLSNIGFLMGTIIGACVMFSNSVYHTIAMGDDYYRYTPNNIWECISLAITNANDILTCIIYDNFLFCTVTTFLLVSSAIWKIRAEDQKKRSDIFWIAFHLLCLVLVWCKGPASIFLEDRSGLNELTITLLEIIIALLYVVSILPMVLCFVEKTRQFRLLLPLYCVVVSLAPLLVVNPIGPRCVFIGYFLMMIFAVDLFGYLCKKMMLEETGICRILGLIVAAQLLFYAYVFYPVHYYDNMRLDFARKQIEEGKQTVFMCELPNGDFLWDGDPDVGKLSERYKLFHGFDERLQFEFISREELKALVEGK